MWNKLKRFFNYKSTYLIVCQPIRFEDGEIITLPESEIKTTPLEIGAILKIDLFYFMVIKVGADIIEVKYLSSVDKGYANVYHVFNGEIFNSV